MDKIIPKKKKTPLQLALIIGLPLLAMYGLFVNFKDVNIRRLNMDASKLVISEVKKGVFLEYVPVEGTVMPFKSVYMDAVEGGMVEQIFKEDGALVMQGEAIMRLSNTNLQLDIMNREAQLFELMDRLQTTKLNYEKNRTSLLMQLSDLEYNYLDAERMQVINEGLFSDKVISRKEFNESENKFNYLKNKVLLTKRMLKQDSISSLAQIQQMKSSISRMDKNMEVMKSKLDNLVVKAPIAGQLTSLSAEVGELKPSGRNLGQIDVLDNFKIRASMDEFYINRVFRDQVATLELDHKNVELLLQKIYPSVKGGKFQIDMTFKNAEDIITLSKKIRRGQSLHLRLEMGDEQQALLISRGGFYQTTGGNWIFVVDEKSNTAVRRDIKIGRQNPESFEVLGGLKAGEKVITSGYENYTEIEKINIEQE